MIAATNDEMVNSLAAFSDLRCEGRRLSFAEPGAKTIRIALHTKEPAQIAYLARLLAHLGYEEIDFKGALLWLTNWGVWDPGVEAIGFKTLERFRRSYGENRSLEFAPGHRFRDDEFMEAVCCLLTPMIVGWDAYYVPQWAYGPLDYFVFASHDSVLDIELRTPEMHAKALASLSSHQWIKAY
jgi:hypothetical protein